MKTNLSCLAKTELKIKKKHCASPWGVLSENNDKTKTGGLPGHCTEDIVKIMLKPTDVL